MASISSNAHRALILNGHRFSGFANVESPIEWAREGAFISKERGYDGALYAKTEPGNIFGAMLTVRLFHDSPSVSWVQNEVNEFARAELEGLEFTQYEGTETNLATGEVTTINGCLLENAPVKAEPNKVYEVVFAVEEAFTIVDGKRTPVTVSSRA